MKLSFEYITYKRTVHQERLVFTKHLSTMMKAGVTITEALEIITEQSKYEYFKRAIAAISHDIKSGKTLSASLSKHSSIFDGFYISLIEVSEESGTLSESLDFLVERLQKQHALRKKVRGALAYPVVVVTASVVMAGFVAVFVLPRLVEFFESLEVDLPLPTKILIFVAQTSKNFGIFIIIGLFLFAAIVKRILQTSRVKPVWHNFLLKAPVLGNINTSIQIANLTRNLGTLLKSGVPIVDSLAISSKTTNNQCLKDDLLRISRAVEKGASIGDFMRKNKFERFPILFSRMIAVGERTGQLDETLLYLADFYEEEADNVTKNLSTIIEPVILIVVGLGVGFLALSIISPIYQLTGTIGR